MASVSRNRGDIFLHIGFSWPERKTETLSVLSCQTYEFFVGLEENFWGAKVNNSSTKIIGPNNVRPR